MYLARALALAHHGVKALEQVERALRLALGGCSQLAPLRALLEQGGITIDD